MERQLTSVGRDIGLASALLLVIGVYISLYAWLFTWSATLASVLLAIHGLVITAVLVSGVRRARRRTEEPAHPEWRADDAIPEFVTVGAGASQPSQPTERAACTVTDLTAVRHRRRRSTVTASRT